MTSLSTKQKEFWASIKSILWKDWDPIGVYEPDGEWDDEYDSYVPHIFRLAIEGNDQRRIANSLASSAEQNMGLNPSHNLHHELRVAELILQSKRSILES